MEDLLLLLLALELVLHVITSSLPAPGCILVPSHIVTRTLLSFTLVCHETRRLADGYLHQYCVYLDSSTRLHTFLSASSARRTAPHVTRLSLAPFEGDILAEGICHGIHQLLNISAHSLTKLVIDMPLWSVRRGRDHNNLLSVLRDGFEKLTNLEEFVSVQDELDLGHERRESFFVWSLWQKLKRLALHCQLATDNFWRHVAMLTELETIVLTIPHDIFQINSKAEYFKPTRRPLRVVVCFPEKCLGQIPSYMHDDWRELNPENSMSILVHPSRTSGPVERGAMWDGPSRRLIKPAAENNCLWN
ncbi:hypothetical protein T440DRAFT_465250 [Plenodomus tracheiphilus IPT5]|uniref:F-box domain-containing protein n=1 Tax=Plenodomus tracheiphilus IPT5 TaxID=1408161 RepID=A0A6A7BFR8_9PLEO|nr:hypothetical protein T440DRAFT_465250 [Plenodomus tracheiphilus IPT5]